MPLASQIIARAWRRALLLAWFVPLLTWTWLAPPLRAQTVRWQQTYGLTHTTSDGPAAFNGLNAAVATPDGGFLLAGSTQQNIPGSANVGTYGLVVKVDTAGHELWKKSWGLTYTSGIYTSASNDVNAAVATPDGGFLLAGKTRQNIPGGTAGTYGLVVKVDASGNVRWQKTCGLICGSGSYARATNILHAAVATPDGGFLLAGSTYQDIPGTISAGTYGLVVKVDASGNVLWQKTCGLIYRYSSGPYAIASNSLQAAVATPDGGFLLTGVTTQYIPSSTNPGNTDESTYGLVVKVSAGGNMRWQKTCGLTYTSSTGTHARAYNRLNAAVATPDGGFLLAGYASQPIPSTTSTGRYGLVVKVDTSGNVLSQQTYGFTHTSGTYTYATNDLSAAVATPDGGFLLAGTTQDVSGSTTGPYGLLVKVDASGQALWPEPYTVSPAAGLTNYSLKAAVATPGGGVLLAGQAHQSPGTPAGYYGWAVQLDSVALSLLHNPSFEAAPTDTARWVALPPHWYHYQGLPALGPLHGQPLAKAADGQTYLALAAYHHPDSLYHEAIVQPLALQNEATYLFELDLAHSPLDLTQVLLGRWKAPARLQLWLSKSLEGDFGYVSMQDPQAAVKIYEQQPESSRWKRYQFRYTVPANSDFKYLIVRASADSGSRRALVLLDHLTILQQVAAGAPPAAAQSRIAGREPAAASAHTTANLSPLRAYPNPVSQQLRVDFELTQAGTVSLELINLQGQRRVLLREQVLGAGSHRLAYATGSWPSGLYLLRLRQGARLWQVKVVKP